MTKIKESFLAIQQYEDLANLLSFSTRTLLYYFFKKKIDNNYTHFYIVTKGKKRLISTPNTTLKYIQKKLCDILEEIYTPKKCVNAFVSGRSIVSNAIPHLHANIILRIDLKDFFPSIHFGRVKQLFASYPFYFPDNITTLLAKICCYNGSLPQGSPLSPIISNMICYRMDNQFLKLCRNCNCIYTRYADDITISTRKNEFQLATVCEDNCIQVSNLITTIISNNYFKINDLKTRLIIGHASKIVTGIKVNTKLNTARNRYREIRAMLHALEKYGPDKALEEYKCKYTKRQTIKYNAINFFNVILGKIAFLSMVRGNNDILVAKLKIKLYQIQELYLLKKFNFHRKLHIEQYQKIIINKKPLIICEGKTDRIILSKALLLLQKNNKFKHLDIHFYIHNDYNSGQINLHNFINNFSKIYTGINFNHPIIFIFDRDAYKRDNFIIKKDDIELPRYHGNCIWSFLLPIPSFRSIEFDDSISIEHYFSDALIQSKDDNDRRLFFFNEFVKKDNIFYLSDNNDIKLLSKNKNAKQFTIIDDKVINNKNENIARTKFDFAKEIVLNNKFDDKSMNAFENIFKKIEYIINL